MDYKIISLFRICMVHVVFANSRGHILKPEGKGNWNPQENVYKKLGPHLSLGYFMAVTVTVTPNPTY